MPPGCNSSPLSVWAGCASLAPAQTSSDGWAARWTVAALPERELCKMRTIPIVFSESHRDPDASQQCGHPRRRRMQPGRSVAAHRRLGARPAHGRRARRPGSFAAPGGNWFSPWPARQRRRPRGRRRRSAGRARGAQHLCPAPTRSRAGARGRDAAPIPFAARCAIKDTQ